MGKFIDGEYVSDSSMAKYRGTSGLETPEYPAYPEPSEHKFTKRVFDWIKKKKTRVIPSEQVGIVPDGQVLVGNGNESIVWEKETIKQGPAYKLVQTTKLVKLSDFKEIEESEQNISNELTELSVEVDANDWQTINNNIERQPKPKPRPFKKKLIPVSEAPVYTPPKRKGNVIKANPFVASPDNLIPLTGTMYFAHNMPQNKQSHDYTKNDLPYDADEIMRQEYLRNRNRPGYLTPVDMREYENVMIDDTGKVIVPEETKVVEPVKTEAAPKGRKKELNLMDEMDRFFGDVLE